MSNAITARGIAAEDAVDAGLINFQADCSLTNVTKLFRCANDSVMFAKDLRRALFFCEKTSEIIINATNTP